jgi:antitoxin (DNA-binding transcriptional repressor) of toxin-antitoxin stability system
LRDISKPVAKLVPVASEKKKGRKSNAGVSEEKVSSSVSANGDQYLQDFWTTIVDGEL